jgi:hypothetical protein
VEEKTSKCQKSSNKKGSKLKHKKKNKNLNIKMEECQQVAGKY